MSFDKIIGEKLLELETTTVSIKGSDDTEYEFTVKELTPHEIAYCLDDFNKIDLVLLVARSVYDKDGKRMTIEQAQRLPSETLGKFITAYDKFNNKELKKKEKIKN